MVKLLIVRHAKTAWNIARKIQGRSDVPLSDEGRQAAREAAAAFEGRRIDKVFSSPLVRAKETAEIMLGMEVQTDERLIERDFGAYDGQLYTELSLEDHDRLFYSMDDIENAEKDVDIFSRTQSFLCDLKSSYDGKTVAIFSHGVCISFLLYAARNEKWIPEKYRMEYIKNCEIHEVTI